MRKQLLLGSTALIVAALAAPDFAAGEEPLRLEVHGFKNEFFGIGDVDVDGFNFNNTGEFSDGEIQFRGETALDNGLTVGVQVELETDARGDQIDERRPWSTPARARTSRASRPTKPVSTTTPLASA